MSKIIQTTGMQTVLALITLLHMEKSDLVPGRAVIGCLTLDRGVACSSLTKGTAMCKTLIPA